MLGNRLFVKLLGPRRFHGLAIGSHSPKRPAGLVACDMKELHFTNDFVEYSIESFEKKLLYYRWNR